MGRCLWGLSPPAASRAQRAPLRPSRWTLVEQALAREIGVRLAVHHVALPVLELLVELAQLVEAVDSCAARDGKEPDEEKKREESDMAPRARGGAAGASDGVDCAEIEVELDDGHGGGGPRETELVALRPGLLPIAPAERREDGAVAL